MAQEEQEVVEDQQEAIPPLHVTPTPGSHLEDVPVEGVLARRLVLRLLFLQRGVALQKRGEPAVHVAEESAMCHATTWHARETGEVLE